MITTILSQEAAYDLLKFYKQWKSSNVIEKQKMTGYAEEVYLAYCSGDLFLEPFINRLVGGLMTLYIDTGIPKITDEEIDEGLKKMEAYQIESAK